MASISRLKMLWTVVCFFLAGVVSSPHIALAQKQPEEIQREQKLRDEALNTLDTLGDLLRSRDRQLETIKQLTEELKATKEEAIKKTVEEKIKAEKADLAKLDQQISVLTTAVTEEEADGDRNQKFNLQAELESLAEGDGAAVCHVGRGFFAIAYYLRTKIRLTPLRSPAGPAPC